MADLHSVLNAIHDLVDDERYIKFEDFEEELVKRGANDFLSSRADIKDELTEDELEVLKLPKKGQFEYPAIAIKFVEQMVAQHKYAKNGDISDELNALREKSGEYDHPTKTEWNGHSVRQLRERHNI